MKKLLFIIICGFTLLANSQDDKKTPEKKLVTKNNTTIPVTGKPERKMVDPTTAKKEKVTVITNGKPEKKLVTK